MPTNMKPVPVGRPTFVGAPRCEHLDRLEADVAIVGVPHSTPYDVQGPVGLSGDAPNAVREQSMRLAPYLTHYNFDFEGDILANRTVRIVDCGDVAMRPGAYQENRRAVSSVIGTILSQGVVPIVLGGDHGVSIPVIAGFESFEPICVVQIDAHLDWRDEINGAHFGQSSPMRRASEMDWVDSMVQIGLRGTGSARLQEVDAARDFGSILVTADELHTAGVEKVLSKVPAGARYYVTVDIDALDPSIAPGTGFPLFGGLSYYEATGLLRGIVSRGCLVGLDVVEIAPSLDTGNTTSFLAAQLILNTLGALAHGGQIGSAATQEGEIAP